jgi:mitogen-activated protein kinase kinase kinase 11
VLELSQLSPRLKELQTVILNDFEAMQKQNHDSEGIWDLLTEYIDKLHSVELLIVEDLELSLPNSTSSNTSSEPTFPTLLPTISQLQPPPEQSPSSPNYLTQALQHALSTSSNKVALISQVEAMLAKEVKASVLAALKAEKTPNGTVTSQPNTNDSLVTTLNEDIQEALQHSISRTRSMEWDISIYEIKFNKRIGQGASATTYLADWSGQKVAVKVASITEFGLDGWRREVAALQRLHHPNVIRLMGSVEHQNPLTYCLVLEYCNAGDLNTALKYSTPRNFFFHVAISIANAMAYLHKRHTIHRDLKPHNVLCHGNIAGGNYTVKVTDFGVAAEHFGLAAEEGLISENLSKGTASGLNLTGETGTYRWMAPEVIRHEPYSSMADVYSFAVIVWQLLTHDEPFVDADSLEAAMLVATNKIRPPLPENAPESIVNLINSNWSDNPSDRWGFEKLATTLEQIKENITADEKKWLDAAEGHPVYVYDLPEIDAEISHTVKGNPDEKGRRRASGLLGNFFGVQKKFGGKGRGK